ncbi:MAG: hypothetical protein A3C43_07785 [Candidatus Schekmanbacteria bacterium RIFCSPHIGHO2_02_FULL_38_11]|uniref:AB hydrolase-1 domain-containing protein n=1 Tax=Candidatus Schekmanbacteria bacterium RIFCSPLOWO2_12_FULL_38_15 TaxID=1817883 RepID=A0A1F7SHB0_9BACT|nr:MAG: hypothetical protein A2043_10630 [Candidatus Schekmanbacteria bacterium GWA2_38_9]OGL48939.1 MAG: hypothetical protein A3H37_07755 [Candidatus Schekmanbacteria bacterium RIFCSPLOWO2_02_FULL_38_14]OGL50403.1 MAG: hypothetical protein A3C43_07785 [Candidatus Schekmanbacteria bacterium RIFCSPHIGHO2_02_FULL_38_11]OGL53135.1 MAG: hypothetical protein A3G31_12470 [Candidatus Schekmanbacteria bacterium RIFCSPLOWO2_12_FULL_38_15]
MFSEKIKFSSSGLTLEGILDYNEKGSSENLLILFSPHPKLGGDMMNNVLCGIAEYLAKENFFVFRFNYRGVGESEKLEPEVTLYDYWERLDSSNDYSEIFKDSFSVLENARKIVEAEKIFMAGYSFGARVLEELALKTEIKALAGISLPLGRYDFQGLAALPLKKLFVWGEKDFAAGSDEIDSFSKTVMPPKKIAIIKNQDHFFRGYEKALAEMIGRFFIVNSRQ